MAGGGNIERSISENLHCSLATFLGYVAAVVVHDVLSSVAGGRHVIVDDGGHRVRDPRPKRVYIAYYANEQRHNSNITSIHGTGRNHIMMAIK